MVAAVALAASVFAAPLATAAEEIGSASSLGVALFTHRALTRSSSWSIMSLACLPDPSLIGAASDLFDRPLDLTGVFCWSGRKVTRLRCPTILPIRPKP